MEAQRISKIVARFSNRADVADRLYVRDPRMGILFLVTLVGSVFCTAEALASPPDGKSWKLIWSDEFNGSSIDTSKWNFFLGWDTPHWRDAFYTNDDAYLEDGNLVIRSRKDGELFKTGGLTTRGKFEQKYGYFEIRANMSGLEAFGQWVAFWLYTFNGPYNHDPNTGVEIDIMEYVWMDDRTHHAVHWGNTDTHETRTPGLRTGFHTFGLQWDEEKYIFYIDNRVVWTSRNGVSRAPQWILLTSEIQNNTWGSNYKIGDYAHQLPDYWIVDYVRVYEPGSAASVPPTKPATPNLLLEYK